MKFLYAGRLFLLSAAILVPGIVPGIARGQAATLPTTEAEPPVRALAPQDPAALPGTPPPATPAAATQPRQPLRAGGGVSLPAQDPATPPAPPRAARTRAATAERAATIETAPAIAAPAFAPSNMTYYTQSAPYYRYSTPLDKEMQELVKKEQELAKKTTELVASLKGATAEKKTEIKTQLIASVEAHFGVRQEQRELQLKRIEEEVKKLREAIEKRNTSKKEIIERRIAELTGEDTIGF